MDESPRRLEFAATVTLVYFVAALLLLVPGWFLAVGIQASGDAAGWWQGDPNSNDGEETFATVLGAAGVLVILPCAALAVARAGRWARVRPAVAIVVGSALLGSAVAALVVGVVAS
jgi:hypothetical protein